MTRDPTDRANLKSRILACAFGVRAPVLDDSARGFFAETNPWAFILFREACVEPAQVKRLSADLREAVGRPAPIFIDQEGGRVARRKAPHWPLWPPCGAYGALYEDDAQKGLKAAQLGFRLIAHELRALGVTGDFAPVLDIPAVGSDAIVGDRAFSGDPKVVAALGRAALEGLEAGALAGCVKHTPGHGRATCDSHLSLPRVCASADELETDMAPFRALADAPAAMTAHIVYEAFDPDLPATCSSRVIDAVIRGRIGFGGLLMSDDLDMHALNVVSESLAERARAALAAGCDIVLQCSGRLADMAETAKGVQDMNDQSLARAARVEAIGARAPEPFDVEEGWRTFNALVGAR